MRDLDFLFNLNPRSIGRCTQIDYDRDMAFVAVSASNGDRDEITGEIRAFRYPDGATAERCWFAAIRNGAAWDARSCGR